MGLIISDTAPRVQYTAANTQTQFTIPFEFFADADIKVIKTASNGTDTTLTLASSPANATQYSVEGAGVSAGGTKRITLGGASTNGDKYTIFRELAVERTSDFPVSGNFPIETLNTELDKITAMIQQNESDNKFSPQAKSSTSTAYGLVFPELVANKILTVNSGGTALEFSQSITDVATVAGIAGDITTVSGIASNVTAVAGNATNINAVANDATDIGAVAAKATEIGRLGTSAAVADMAILATDAIVADMAILGTDAIVADMAILGTDAVVADMAILATNDVVADMNVLATSDVVTDMNTLGTSDVVSDMNTLGTSDVVSDMNTLASSSNVNNMNTLAGISSNITTVAGISGNVTTVASNNSNVTTVASNISNVNSFANTYRIGSSDPSTSLNEGDLFYNSTSNVLKFYNGSAWVAISADTDSLVKVSSNDTTAGFLNGKLVAGTNISLTEGNDGGNETLTASLSGTITPSDNTVTLAKLAPGTDGNLISYDSSGNPVAVATGNDGQVLTSTGAGSPPVFETIPSGTTINNNANNRIITGSGTANTLEGEANLTFDGTLAHINSTASGNTLHTLLKLETDGTADGSGITIDTRTAHTRGEINFLDGTGSYDSNYVFKTATGSQLATPTEKFRVSPTGATVTGDLTITGSIVGGGISGNTPNFCVIEGGQQTLQHNTYTNLDFGTEIVDSNNAFTSNKFTVPSGQGGTYYLECQINFYDAQGKLSSGMIALWKGNNGTKLSNLYNVYTGKEASHLSFSVSTLAVLNAGDVIGAAATITTTDGLSVTSYGGDGGSRIMGFKVS